MRKYIVEGGKGRGGYRYRITLTVEARSESEARQKAREDAKAHHRQWRGVRIEVTH